MLRAILIASGHAPAVAATNDRYGSAMLPVADRPIIQHVVEFLARQQCTRFDVVLSHLPEQVERHLENGQRWGCSIQYHLVRNPDRFCDVFKRLSFDDDSPVLIALADRLAAVGLGATANLPSGAVVLWDVSASGIPSVDHGENVNPSPPSLASGEPANAAEPRWTGWALVPANIVSRIPAELSPDQLEDWLVGRSSATIERRLASQCLSTAEYPQWLEANDAAMTKRFDGLLSSGREVDAGIWISRNVMLPPTVRLTPPVFIGENCQIGQGASLGPNVVISRDCMIDATATLAHSIVLPGSYVGEGLELDRAIVDHNRLINVRLGAAIHVRDDFLLSAMRTTGPGRLFFSLLERLAAIVMLVVTSPLLAATALWLKATRSGPLWRCCEAVALPAPSDTSGWRTASLGSFATTGSVGSFGPSTDSGRLADLLLRFLPGLVAVLKGDLHFVGLAPRTKGQVGELPPDWRSLYLQSKAGIVTEAHVVYGADPSPDDLYSAESYYAVARGFWHDLSLLLVYLRQQLFGRRRVATLVDEPATVAP